MKNKVSVENAKVMPRDDYIRTLEEIVAKGFCPFCEEHFFKHHRNPILCESRYWLVTENSWPYPGSRFHILFIAKKHIERTEDMSIGMWGDLHRMYWMIVKEKSLKGATLLIRSGDMQITGASVNHLHAHLVVGGQRTKGAKLIKALVGFEE